MDPPNLFTHLEKRHNPPVTLVACKKRFETNPSPRLSVGFIF
jgi:hypothetical protein